MPGCAPFCAQPRSKTVANGSNQTGSQSPLLARRINTIANRRTASRIMGIALFRTHNPSIVGSNRIGLAKPVANADGVGCEIDRSVRIASCYRLRWFLIEGGSRWRPGPCASRPCVCANSVRSCHRLSDGIEGCGKSLRGALGRIGRSPTGDRQAHWQPGTQPGDRHPSETPMRDGNQPRPGDFPIGSVQSRAAARAMFAEQVSDNFVVDSSGSDAVRLGIS